MRHFTYSTVFIWAANYLYLKEGKYCPYSEGLNYVDGDMKGSPVDFIV